MHQLTLVAATATLMVALGACGGTASQASSGSKLSAKEPQWEGTIRAREARTGAATPSTPAAMYQGSVRMTRVEGDISRSNIHIFLSGPARDNSDPISWVLASGRCGSVENPVLPVTSFDPLEMGSNGRVDATVKIAYEFPTSGMYHVDFFSGHSARITQVIACAELKFKD